MTKEKILLISCYFPPAGGINVQRILSLARYLPQNGFRVFVVSARSSVPMMDSELVKLIPKDVEVHRTWTLEPPFRLRKKLWSRVESSGPSATSRNGFVAKVRGTVAQGVKRLVCPDPQVLWYSFAIRRASKLIRKEGIQTVLVTTPPFSAFLIVNELKCRFPHLCTIADIRDEWLDYFVNEFVFRGDKYISARAAQIERATVESCNRIVNVTAASLDRIRSRYPEQPHEKFVLIPNGYDPAAFCEFRSRSHEADKLVFTYTGTVYNPASPKWYLDALDGLSEIRSGIETRIVGRIAEEFDRGVFENRQSSIRFFDFVPQTDARRFMEETDVLLLPWTDRINIPGKFYEYLATGKPILALCYPDSEVARIMERAAAGWVVNPDDPGAIQRGLTEIHALGGKYPRERNWQVIRRFERPRLAAEYAQVIRGASLRHEQLEFVKVPAIVNEDREGDPQIG
jgi:glycosyltransferase involved in cell wall biosynthesis